MKVKYRVGEGVGGLKKIRGEKIQCDERRQTDGTRDNRWSER